jgi:hypothetical protein
MPSGNGWGQLWRWPLYSPRRFFSCLAVLLALVAVSNMIFGGGSSLPPADRDATASAATVTPSETGTATPTDPLPLPSESGLPSVAETPPSPTASPRPATSNGARQAATTALAFTRAWADHAKPAPQWLAGVSRYADPEFATQLKSTDPRNVPASKVTGAPHPVAVYYASASVEVPTDAGMVVVELVSDGHAWRVVDIHPKA